jgi:DNA-binding response OmpR family regulator
MNQALNPESRRFRVLVAEDDGTLSYLVQEALAGAGYQVAAADNPARALALHREQRMDLIILDRMFPDQDGLEAVRELRLAGDPVPVLMLTSRSDVADRVAGLGEGADDYMGKPFSILELQARVQALLRRARVPAPTLAEVARHGPFTLDWTQSRMERDGHSLDLTPQEFRIVATLLRASGQALTRKELLEHAWPASGRPALERTVDVYIARLRGKLGRPGDPAWIRTLDAGRYAWNAEAID